MFDPNLLQRPLPLVPRLEPKVWGGSALGELFGKSLPGGEPLGESWEVYDRPGSSSLLAGVPGGITLHDLLEEDPEGLLGPEGARDGKGSFPLMVKFLDARDLLSIQVHPGWDYAALEEGDRGKAEAWVVVSAMPQAKVYHGLRAGADRAALERAAREGTLPGLLRSFRPEPGEVIWIPPGTVHGMGGGVVVYEIQTNSEVTYRLYDWDRPGRDGRPRELHLEKALEVIDFSREPGGTPPPREVQPGRTLLLETPWFVLERFGPPWCGAVGGGDGFTLLSVLEGDVRVGGEGGLSLGPGATVLLPARAGASTLEGRGCSSWSVLSARPGRSR